jgi:transglutaminase-like putative cysteine protease
MNTTYDVDCELNYEVLAPSTMVFKIEAAHVPGQLIHTESMTTLPPLPLDRDTDWLGNRTVRAVVPTGNFSIRYQASVEVVDRPLQRVATESDVSDLPLDVMLFLTGSRYVESELMFPDAVQWIGTHDRGHARVERICEWVRRNVRYEIGTSLPYGTARDVLSRRTGVCRDLAHVAIGLCRALNIPARLVVGHVQWDTPPPDFHAIFEAFIGGRWVMFDPTEMAPPGDVIRIGTGADAADLPFATIFGSAQMTRMAPLVFRSIADHRAAA